MLQRHEKCQVTRARSHKPQVLNTIFETNTGVGGRSDISITNYKQFVKDFIKTENNSYGNYCSAFIS